VNPRAYELQPQPKSRMAGPFWHYFGGKWRAAPHYPAPRHRRIIEPFAGSAGYSMRHHEHDVVLVEKNPIIAEMWRYLIAVKPADGLPPKWSSSAIGR